MGFTPGQRPWSPWTSFGNWQGQYELVTDLPNSSTAAYQPGVPNVQEGDLAWVDGAPSGLYVCTDPTPGAAVWELLSTGGGGLSNVTYANTVFVTKDGNDGTGLRESLTFPFLTIAAALAVAQDGDQVWIGPGTFAEAALVIPNTLSPLTIRGSGKDTTFITRASGDGIVVTGNVASQILTLADFDLTMAPGAATALMVNGFGSLLPYVGLRVENVRLSSSEGEAMQLNAAQDYYFEGVTFVSEAGGASYNNSTGVSRDCDTVDQINVGRDLINIDAGTGWNLFDSCTIGRLSMSDQVQIHTLPSTWVKGETVAALTDDGVTGPRVMIEHACGDPGSVFANPGDIQMLALPAVLANTVLRVRCTGLYAAATWEFTSAAGAIVDANGSKPLGGTTITVSGTILLSMRGVPTENLILTPSSATAAVDRDVVAFQGLTLVAATPLVTTIDPPLASANYSVAYSSTTGSDILRTAKAVTDFTLVSAAGATGVDAILTRNT